MMNFTQRKKLRIIFSFAFALHFNPFDPTLEQKDAKKEFEISRILFSE